MTETNKGPVQQGTGDRVWHRVLLAVILPCVLQMYVLYALFVWSNEDAQAAGFLPLAGLMVMALAIPIALIANTWVVYETRHWRIYWVVLVGYLQAVVIPVAIVVSFLWK